VTFPEFVHYVLWENKHRTSNHHWKRQHDICQPCHIQYDTIGFYETLQDDVKYILEKISAGPNVSLVPRSTDTPKKSSNGFMKLYDTIPVSSIRELLDIYKIDYRLFGYQIPDRILSRLRE